MQLYKYVPPTRIDILQKMRIRFTQPELLNDPYEFVLPIDLSIAQAEFEGIVSSLIPKDVLSYLPLVAEQLGVPVGQRAKWQDDIISQMQAHPETLKQIQDQFDVLMPEVQNKAFLQMGQQMKASTQSLFDAFRRSFGVLSLAGTATSEVMWGDYAASHTGFLVGFDSNHSWFQPKDPEDQARHLRKVTYVDNPPPRDPRTYHNRELFYTKRMAWAHQREWRMCRPLTDGLQDPDNTGDENLYLVPIPPDCITSVVLGIRASERLEEDVKLAIRGKQMEHVSVERVRQTDVGLVVEALAR